MQSPANLPGANGMVHFMSKHRFRLALLIGAFAFVLMLATIYGTIGLGPIWARFAVPPV